LAEGETMNAFKSIAIMTLSSIPFIAWVPANFWTLCGDPWCLKIFPEWLDKIIASLALPFLDKDILTAAEQINFLEVWLSSAIIMEIVALLILFLSRNVFKEDDDDDGHSL
jgi:hypothetical protein